MSDHPPPREPMALLRDMIAATAQPDSYPDLNMARAGHYFSTYCVHERHEQCRLRCKTCGTPCRCRCHGVTAPTPDRGATMTTTITSACPNCGAVEERRPYDIGSGPELSCAQCEACWGADGQALKALVLDETDLPGWYPDQDTEDLPDGYPHHDLGARIKREHKARARRRNKED